MKRDKNAPGNADTAASTVGADDLIKTARSELTQLLDKAFSNLKSVATLKEDGKPPGLFFPNGIELIYVKLAVGLPEKPVVTVELKIAGEKGVKAVGTDYAAGNKEQIPATSKTSEEP
jgi:hypothetical protein